MSEKDQVLTAEGVARRRFLKQAGVVAWGAPMIVTMMSRAAHAQAPCGVQSVNSLGGCNTTGGTPCGTASACVPDPENLGAGEPCICIP